MPTKNENILLSQQSYKEEKKETDQTKIYADIFALCFNRTEQIFNKKMIFFSLDQIAHRVVGKKE
jgi:hypothetical protein